MGSAGEEGWLTATHNTSDYSIIAKWLTAMLIHILVSVI